MFAAFCLFCLFVYLLVCLFVYLVACLFVLFCLLVGWFVCLCLYKFQATKKFTYFRILFFDILTFLLFKLWDVVHVLMWNTKSISCLVTILTWLSFFTECRMPLGLQNGDILNSQITSSSDGYDPDPNCCYARFVRLHNNRRWRANVDDLDKWIKIDLIDNHSVTGIVLQGFISWVKTCKIKYKETTGSGALVYILDTYGNEKVFLKFQNSW